MGSISLDTMTRLLNIGRCCSEESKDIVLIESLLWIWLVIIGLEHLHRQGGDRGNAGCNGSCKSEGKLHLSGVYRCVRFKALYSLRINGRGGVDVFKYVQWPSESGLLVGREECWGSVGFFFVPNAYAYPRNVGSITPYMIAPVGSSF